MKVNFNNETLPFCSEPKFLGVTLDRALTYIANTLSHYARSWHHASRSWGSLPAPVGLVEQQRCEHHLSPGAFNHRVLRSCLVTQCSYTPYRPVHQRPLANCDWMPASYTSGQPSNRRRRPTCWASSQCSHTASSTQCHGAWTPAPLSAHPSIECRCTAPQIETPICTRRTTTHQFIWQQQHTCGALGRLPTEGGVDGQPHKTPHFHPWHRRSPPGVTLPSRAWVQLNRLRTGVWRFHFCLYKGGMASSAACECDAEQQTVDHVVLQYRIHRPRHGLHGLTVLDNETIEWLVNICSEIWCGQAVVRTTSGSIEEV